MTEERKQQIMGSIFNYLAELIHQDEELYNVLHGAIGMTQEEIRDCGLFYLIGCFRPETAHDRLIHKIERGYRAYMQKWALCFPDQIIDAIDEIHAVSVAYRILSRRGVSKDNADWLVRFSDPLMVVSDAWMVANDIDDWICEDRMEKIVDEMRDRGVDETEYALDEDEA